MSDTNSMFLEYKDSTSDLLIPIAKDSNGKYVRPACAEKDVSYFCPECKDAVIIRKGTIKRPHFAHKTGQCTQESVVHKAAKELIQIIILAWKAGLRPAPVFVCKCYRCHNEFESPIPDKVDSVELEVTLANGYRVDVGLFEKKIVIAAIEVKVTHAVDDTKAKALTIPFIEVDGYEIIEKPDRLVAIRDSFKPRLCGVCKAQSVIVWRQIGDKILSFLKKIKYPVLTEADHINKYRVKLKKCWNCHREIVVFIWASTMFSLLTPPAPVPSTIRFKYIKWRDEWCWTNTCLFCNEIQADCYSYYEYVDDYYCYNLSIMAEHV